MNNSLRFANHTMSSVYTMQPDSWETVEEAIAILKSGQIVLFNLEGVPAALAQRMTDFTAGCLCAIAGHQVSIGRDVFLFCPPNVKVSVTGLENEPQVWVQPSPEKHELN